MIKFLDILNEQKQKFEYGCVMLYFKFPQMLKIHDAINPKDIYTQEGDRKYGLEDEPHCTLLFGLHDGVSTEDVKSVLSKFVYSPCKLYNASLFENKNYDVLKFDVEGDNLSETNKELQKYPFTSDFPDYHPHVTIAYLKPGTGSKYVKAFKNIEYELTPTHAVYSKPNGDQDTIKIKIKKDL